MTKLQMGTRKAVLECAQCEVDKHGRVIGPGKFEGETVATLIVYYATMHGDGEVVLDEDDFAAFPELKGLGFAPGQSFWLHEDSSGFCSISEEEQETDGWDF